MNNNTAFEDFCDSVDAGLMNSPDDADLRTASNVLSATKDLLLTNHFTRGDMAAGALEQFNTAPQLNSEINLVADGGLVALEHYLDTVGLTPEKGYNSKRRATMIKRLGRILTGAVGGTEHFASGRIDGADLMSTSRVTGAQAFAGFTHDANTATEAFGADIDRVQIDARLNIALSVMKEYKSLLDRVLARVNEKESVVTIKIPENEVYDLSKASDPSSKVRNHSNHRIPMVRLYRNPSPASTAPKKVIPLAVNDDDSQLLADGVLKTNERANLYDLTMDANKVGFSHTDFTDILSEGGAVQDIYVQVVHFDGTTTTTELFRLPVKWLTGGRFVTTGNNNDSGERAAGIHTIYGDLTKGVKTSDDVTSTILATYEGVSLQLAVDFSATLNQKTGDVQGSGSVKSTPVTIGDADTPVDAAITAHHAELTVTIVGYGLDVYFSEENVRKSTSAVRQNTRQQTFEIPVGRTIIVDASLQQTTPDAVLDAVSTVNALGNSWRGLDVITSHLGEVRERNLIEDTHTEISSLESVARSYAAGSLVLPRVIKDTLKFDDANDPILVMRESERLTELHARTRARILATVGRLMTESLYHQELEAGEMPVIKVIAHSLLVDIIFGIDDYHNPLSDEPKGGRDMAGSNYSMLLPNGTRLDIYKTDFESYENRIVGFVVRERDPEGVTSMATIRDKGTFAGSYTLTAQSAAHKRFVVNSREIPFVTCPVGFDIDVVGLANAFPGLVA